MTDDVQVAGVRPATLAWVNRQLVPGERVVGSQTLHGGITAEMRKLAVGTREGTIRYIVLRSYVAPYFLKRAKDLLSREAGALSLLEGTGVVAPTLVAVDPAGAECEYPSLLMTYLPGRAILEDQGLPARIPLLARQLVSIHRLHPDVHPPPYETLTTSDSVVVPKCADVTTWAGAIDLLRKPVPAYDGRFLHRDFQPGNVLFDLPLGCPSASHLVGVIDWAGTSWGPADLDVAHCCTNLALLHGPAWGLRFVDAYLQAGGVLASTPNGRLYWLVRDCLAASEEIQQVSEPWRRAGRTDLTTEVLEDRLNAYLTGLFAAAS